MKTGHQILFASPDELFGDLGFWHGSAWLTAICEINHSDLGSSISTVQLSPKKLDHFGLFQSPYYSQRSRLLEFEWSTFAGVFSHPVLPHFVDPTFSFGNT